MFKKYAILTGLVIAVAFLVIATLYYPGGEQFDKNSVGYSFTKNYLSNLFSALAVNGQPNAARAWATIGMFFLCTSFALFFISTSKKIPEKGAANIVKYSGPAAMIAAFLAVTPLHDIAVSISVTGALVSIFYITVFLFKARSVNAFLKILSVVYMLLFIPAVAFIT